MSKLVGDIDAEIEKRSLLKHPFYKNWSAGALTREDLATYSKEYFQMVKAVPQIVGNALPLTVDERTRRAVSEISAEEEMHIGLWRKFAEALGVEGKALELHDSNARTERALAQLETRTERSLAQVAAAMYAIESEQPRISRTKLDGLQKFYGLDGTGEGTEYFREHEQADVRHAAVWRAVLERLGPEEQEGALDAAILSLETQNAVLDSVMESCPNLSNC